MGWIPLNFALMSQWQNWFIVVLIVWLGGLGMYYVGHPLGDADSDDN